MKKNTCTQLDPKFIQGLTTDEIDEIFITRMLAEYEDYHDFNPRYMVGNFLHYPGLDTMEKVYNKVYDIIQQIMEKGYATCTTIDGKPLTLNELDEHKTDIYKIMNNSDDLTMFSYLFEETQKGRDYVARNYPKHQTIIDEIMRLEENRYQDIERAKKKNAE